MATLFDKLWDMHRVGDAGDGDDLIAIDRLLLHERTGGVALKSLAASGHAVRDPARVFSIMDHIVSFRHGRGRDEARSPGGEAFIVETREMAQTAGIHLIDTDNPAQGIVHVVAPELGIALPGLTLVCPDSHTCSLGALGALAWGIGSSDAEHAMATGTLRAAKPRQMLIRVTGKLGPGVSAKDLALYIIARGSRLPRISQRKSLPVRRDRITIGRADMKTVSLGVSLVALICAGCATPAAPSAPQEPALLGAENPYPLHPINLRRTTLIVRDLEKSLLLYRDALGFDVVYDQELTSPGLDTRYGADGKNRSRLVLTQTNSGVMGMLGLWQFLDPTEKDTAPPDEADFTPGEIVLLFNTTDLESRFVAAASVPGVQVIGAPAERRYPSPAGDIIVMVSMLVDPDGHTIELNQIISDPRASE